MKGAVARGQGGGVAHLIWSLSACTWRTWPLASAAACCAASSSARVEPSSCCSRAASALDASRSATAPEASACFAVSLACRAQGGAAIGTPGRFTGSTLLAASSAATTRHRQQARWQQPEVGAAASLERCGAVDSHPQGLSPSGTPAPAAAPPPLPPVRTRPPGAPGPPRAAAAPTWPAGPPAGTREQPVRRPIAPEAPAGAGEGKQLVGQPPTGVTQAGEGGGGSYLLPGHQRVDPEALGNDIVLPRDARGRGPCQLIKPSQFRASKGFRERPGRETTGTEGGWHAADRLASGRQGSGRRNCL